MVSARDESATDTDQEIVFVIRVRSFGKRPVVQRSAEQSMARALHQTFGADRVDIETAGERLVFDPLADDGHHDGHDEPIRRMPVGEAHQGTGWQPRYVVAKSPHVGGPPIPPDEPCLVVRAQDQLAPAMASFYIEEYIATPGHHRDVLDEMRAHKAQLILWQDLHPPKVADR